MIGFSCSSCGGDMEVPEDQGGYTIRCPRCGRSARVPTLLPIEPAAGGGSAGARPATAGGGSPRAAQGTSPVRRFASPAMLLLAICLFPLPWVQVRCDRPIDDRGTRTLAEQSGLQAVYGGYSENPVLR